MAVSSTDEQGMSFADLALDNYCGSDMDLDESFSEGEGEGNGNNGDGDVTLSQFSESLKAVEALSKCLICVKCKKLPTRKVFTLGSCVHKYCEKCSKLCAGKPCLVCKTKGHPKDAKLDLFSTSVLSEIPAVYQVLNEFNELSCAADDCVKENLGKVGTVPSDTEHVGHKQVDDDEMKLLQDLDDNLFEDETKDDHKMQPTPPRPPMPEEKRSQYFTPELEDKEQNKVPESTTKEDGVARNNVLEALFQTLPQDDQIFESTPKGAVASPSQEVLQETPQPKPSHISLRSRRSLNSNRDKQVRSLNFLSPASKKNEQIGKMKTRRQQARSPTPTKIMEKTTSQTADTGKAATTTEEEQEPQSDDELFQSPPVAACADAPLALPVLTPYLPNATGHQRRSGSGGNGKRKRSESESDNAGGKEQREKSKSRSSGEQDPPMLTPYKPQAVSVPAPAASPFDFHDEDSVNAEEPVAEKDKPLTRPRRFFKTRASPILPLPPTTNVTTKPKTRTTSNKPKKGKVSEGDTGKKETKKLPVSASPMIIDDEPVPSATTRKRRVSTASSVGNASFTSGLNTSLSVGGKEKRNSKGETSLHIACRVGQIDKVKNLVEEGGANVDAVDFAGWTPLHEILNGKAPTDVKNKIVKFFCENGCNTNIPGGPDEETPLHLACQWGLEDIVEILLESGASPNLRNSKGRLPKDVAFNDYIVSLLQERMSKGNCSAEESASPNRITVSSIADEDPAVLQVMVKKALLFFNFDVSPEVLEETKNMLGMKVSDRLSSKVTHIVHKLAAGTKGLRVPLSMEYLFGLGKGMWQVSEAWIEKSIHELQCVAPGSYEIKGSGRGESNVPGLTRTNREKGNPGIFDGFWFYLYKTCGYVSVSGSAIKLSKRDLISLITIAGGKITNRDPNPDSVDPLETPNRFHTHENSQSKFILTSHIILFEKDQPPPESKRYNMEHIKTLRSDWVIDCIEQFSLIDPENYL